MKTVSMCLSMPKFIADALVEYTRAQGKSRGRMVSEVLAYNFGMNITDGSVMEMIDLEEWKKDGIGGSSVGTVDRRDNHS